MKGMEKIRKLDELDGISGGVNLRMKEQGKMGEKTLNIRDDIDHQEQNEEE